MKALPTVRQPRDFSGYREFTAELEKLLATSPTNVVWDNRVEACLNGTAGAELRDRVDISTRRAAGAFFTGSKLSKRLLLNVPLTGDDFIYDPAMGAGDLLLAAARRLPIMRTLEGTLRMWGKSLAGTDLQQEFVEAAKVRIALLARQRHLGSVNLPDNWNDFFPLIRVGDGLEQRGLYSRATHIFMNPPFSISGPLASCKWAGGKISDAALFVVRALEQVEPGTCVRAILPDVLRSGSFQHHWRERVSDLAKVLSVKSYGIFDESADIDVFLLNLARRPDGKSKAQRWPESQKHENETVGDYFEVHVGRVVPHRDKEDGGEHPYIHPRCVPTWTVMRNFSETRKYPGIVYKPPFVVIRRTSRPGHPYRATATVIAGKKPVAVENHLIVCEPKDKELRSCRALMKQLKTEAVNDFLNARICCRHLTVGAVAAIPFKSHE